MEAVWQFTYLVSESPGIVWTVAFIMSGVTAWMLHYHVEDMLRTTVSAFVMYWAIVITAAVFGMNGIIFTDDKEANVVWVAGAAICLVTAVTVTFIRVYYAVSDLIRWLKGAPGATPLPDP